MDPRASRSYDEALPGNFHRSPARQTLVMGSDDMDLTISVDGFLFADQATAVELVDEGINVDDDSMEITAALAPDHLGKHSIVPSADSKPMRNDSKPRRSRIFRSSSSTKQNITMLTPILPSTTIPGASHSTAQPEASTTGQDTQKEAIKQWARLLSREMDDNSWDAPSQKQFAAAQCTYLEVNSAGNGNSILLIHALV
ncbi:hypothetical protein B0H10DRAFT_2229089 [Mycena sp. CBHHK59/15]|nr:hypothetical protein B0H10DRAFT_2229089 [Mycena sp. CBHHK59/15]